jgi:hypothetical protein
MDNYAIQSIIFKKSIWQFPNAVKWLQNMDAMINKVDETENYYRFKQVSPKILYKEGYTVIRNKKIANGIQLVLAYKQNSLTGGSVSVGNIQQFIHQSYNTDKLQDVGNYKLDRELSSIESQVYYDDNSHKCVVVNRGTKEASDWLNNAVYAVNTSAYKLTPRYKRALDTQMKAIKKYGKVDTNIGHSQSGIITRLLNKAGLTGEVINLNPAYKFESQAYNEYNIRSDKDLVSILKLPSDTINQILYPSLKKRNITIQSKTNNILTEHKSDILNRMDQNRMIGKGVALASTNSRNGLTDNPKYQELIKYSDPAKAQELAHQYLGPKIELLISTKKDKKYMVHTPDNKVVHFGQMGMEDFTRHKDEDRKKKYLARATKIKGKWKDNKYSPNNLSINILW